MADVQISIALVAENQGSLQTLVKSLADVRAQVSELQSQMSKGVGVDVQPVIAAYEKLRADVASTAETVLSQATALRNAGTTSAETAALMDRLSASVLALQEGFYADAAAVGDAIVALESFQAATREIAAQTAGVDAAVGAAGESFTGMGVAAEKAGLTANESLAAVRSQAQMTAATLAELGFRGNGVVTGTVSRAGTGAAAAKSTAGLGEAEVAVGAAVGQTTGAIEAQGRSMSYLQKLANSTIFTFLKYQIAMGGVLAVTAEFGSALKQAGDVQVEQKLQQLYGGVNDVNKVLQDSIILAEQWGAKIQDVQQAIGIWAKVTHDQATAEFLTNEALKLHLVSGIATNDVTLTTISLMSKLHLEAGQIPGVYDQIVKASEKMSLPMKNLTSTSGRQEGIREILEGLTEAASSLKAEGFDTAESIATVAAAIQGMGESGKQAGQKLATLFSGLEVGKSGKTFDQIMIDNSQGIDKFNSSLRNLNTIMGGDISTGASFVDKLVGPNGAEIAKKLLQAFKDGTVTVRPQVREALMTIINERQLIEDWSKQLGAGAKGALNAAAEIMVQTWPAQVAKMQASLQAFTITLGQDLLPAAERFVQWLATELFPWLERNSVEILKTAETAGKLFAAFMAFMAVQRVIAMFMGLRAAALELAQAELTAQAAAGKLAVAEGAAGTVAAEATVGVASLSRGFQLMAASAIRAYGPLLALVGVYELLKKAKEGYEQRDAAIQSDVQGNLFNPNVATADITGQHRDLTASAGKYSHFVDLSHANEDLQQMVNQGGALGALAKNAMFVREQFDHGRMSVQEFRTQLGMLDTEMRHLRPESAESIESQKFQALMRQIQSQMNSKATVPGDTTGDTLPASSLAGSTKGMQSATSAVAQAVRELIDRYTALEDKMGKVTSGIEAQITGFRSMHNTVGWTVADMEHLHKLYIDAETAVGSRITLTNKEIAALQKKIAADQQALATMTPGTTIYAATQAAIDKESDALQRATGEVSNLTGELKKLHDEAVKDLDTAFNKMFNGDFKALGTPNDLTSKGAFTDFSKTNTGFENTFSQYQTRLQALVSLQKNQELPTLAELQRQYVLEQTAHDKLAADLQKEIALRDEISKKIADISSKLADMKAHGEENTTQFKEASAQLDILQQAFQGVDTAVLTDQADMQQLGNTMTDTLTKMSQAGRQFAIDFAASMTAGMKAGMEGIGSEMTSSFDKLFKRTFVGGGAISTFMRDMIGGAISSALNLVISGPHGLANNFQGWFSKMLGLGVGESPDKALKEAAAAHVHAAKEVLKIHETKIYHVHERATARHLLAAGKLIDAANAIIAAAGGGPGTGFGTPQTLAMGPMTSDVNYGLNASGGPITSNDYVLDDSLNAQQQTADGINQLVDMAQNASTPGTSGATPMSGADTAGIGGDITGLGNDATGLLKGNAKAFWQKTMQNVAIGLGAGDLFGSLMQGGDTGTHTIWGELGGAIGGLFGPIGAVAGGLLGSLFGHTNNPANMPDQYGIPGIGLSAQGYQQWLQVFNGGQGDVISQLQSFISGGGMKGLTAAQMAIFQQLKNLGGPGDNLGVAGEKNGVFTLGSGQQISASDYIQLTTQAQAIMQQVDQNRLTAAQNAAALADSFITRILNAPQGFTMPGLVGGYVGTAPSGGGVSARTVPGMHYPGGGAPVPGRVVPLSAGSLINGGAAGGGEIHVHVLEGATITSDMAGEIQKALPDITDALADAVNKSNFLNNRRTGNYISAL